MVEYLTVAIDPVALILPPDIYVKWVEGKHPHTLREIVKFTSSLTPEEIKSTVDEIKNTQKTLKIWDNALSESIRTIRT